MKQIKAIIIDPIIFDFLSAVLTHFCHAKQTLRRQLPKMICHSPFRPTNKLVPTEKGFQMSISKKINVSHLRATTTAALTRNKIRYFSNANEPPVSITEKNKFSDINEMTTPKGEIIVIMSKERYQELLQFAEIEAVNNAVERGEEELIDGEFVNELLFSDTSKIKLWRKYRGLTAKALAEMAGITSVHLSNIENGKKKGSIELYMDIAEALKVDVDDILPRRNSS